MFGVDNNYVMKKSLKIRGEIVQLEEPKVMGILNITPDSFYANSRVSSENEILNIAGKMYSDGAWILDIGGMSSRPGSEEIDIETERNRVVWAIKTVRKHFPEILVSVDTYRSVVARSAINEGADMINDISGAQFDPEILDVASSSQVPYILMHTPGKPSEMSGLADYGDVFGSVFKYFSERISLCHQKGISDIILDPGFGFGKTLDQNWELMRKLDLFSAFELPILVGISRKSMINKLLEIKAEDALNASTVLNTIALLQGGNILRVHDVKEAVQTIKMVNQFR